MNSKTFFVDQSFKDQINQIRMHEYSKASGFQVDLSTLQWRNSDDESFVMAAHSSNELVATMRGEVIDELNVLEKKLECPWDFGMEIRFPVLLLSRAATSSSHRGQGMNLVLRYWFLRFAQHHGIPFVLGTFVTGSPRERSLREMGYEFFENTLGWQQSTYRSLRPVTVVALDMTQKGDQALSYCLERAADGISRFAFEGHFPDLRIVRSL